MKSLQVRGPLGADDICRVVLVYHLLVDDLDVAVPSSKQPVPGGIRLEAAWWHGVVDGLRAREMVGIDEVAVFASMKNMKC